MPFPVEDVTLGDLAVPLAHQGGFYGILDRFDMEEFVFIDGPQFPDDKSHESFCDGARFGLILNDLESRPEDGMPDLFGIKFNDGPIPFLDSLGDRPFIHE